MQPSCKNYIPSFSLLLKQVNIAEISTDEYCKKYLVHLLQHQLYYLHIYAQVLDNINAYLTKAKNETTLVDIGTGNGLLAIFAKYCGYKKVYCNDMSIPFLEAAGNLAQQLKIAIDGYIAGQIDEVQQFFKAEKPDALMGTDVIEHIYDAADFIKTVSIINPLMVTVFTTASNPQNIFLVKKLRQLQIRDEQIGYDGNSADATAHPPFFYLRKKIIADHFKQLPESTISQLAKATRGSIESDILNKVNAYIQTGQLPVPAENENTCNPYTGSWTERLLPISTYKSMYNSQGFSLSMYNGFYNDKEKNVKSYINKIRNIFVQMIGGKISPFIGLVGFKK